MEINSEYRVVVVGKTGNGKSSLCNSLSGTKGFQPSASSASGTQKCQKKTVFLPEHKTVLTIIDTPGVFDTGRPQADTLDEIIKCIALAAPGPHVFLFVLSIRRYTEEEHESFKLLEKLFGDKVRKYAIVVFTSTDQLEDDDDEQTTLDDYVRSSPIQLRELLRKCGNRFVGISNRKKCSSHKSDVDNVLRKIKETVELNGNQFYDHTMFKRADEIIKKKVDEEKEASPQMSIREIREKIEKEIGPLSDLIEAALPILVNVASRQCSIS